MAIGASGRGLQGSSESPDLDASLDGQDLDGRAPPFSPCELTFDEEEPRMFWGPDHDDSKVFEASHALIEMQWSKWRQAVTELKPIKNPRTGGRR